MRRTKSLVWWIPFALLVGVLVIVPVRMLEPEGVPRYRALRAELDRLSEENDALARQVRDLDLQVKSLKDDPAAVERIARDDLGMVRADELLFQFNESATKRAE